MTSVYDVLSTGGGRIEYLWHVGGMPWSFATSKALATAIRTGSQSVRKEIFGRATISGWDLCDNVRVYVGLEPPGSQSFRLHDAQGMPAGGDWSVTVTRDALDNDYVYTPSGPIWYHRSGSIWGADGLHCLPDYRYDSNICHSFLSRNFLINDDALFVSAPYDTGGRLYDAIDTSDFKILWIGKEAIAVSAVYSSSGEYEIDAGTSPTRGVFRSQETSHYLENNYAGNTIVADAPIGGISGSPSYLWAIPMVDTTIVGDPVLIRHGTVGQGIKSQGGFTTVPCLPWIESLKSALNFDPVETRISGYTISRPDSTWEGADEEETHLAIREWTAGDVYFVRKIWLCADGDTAYFANREDLFKAINEELARCYDAGPAGTTALGSEGTIDLYQIVDGKMQNRSTTGQNGCTLFGGTVAIWLNIGSIADEELTAFKEYMDNCEFIFAINENITRHIDEAISFGKRVYFWTSNADDELREDTYILGDSYCSEYLHQYYYRETSLFDNMTRNGLVTWPPCATSGIQLLHLPDDDSDELFALGDSMVTIGREDVQVKGKWGTNGKEIKTNTMMEGVVTNSFDDELEVKDSSTSLPTGQTGHHFEDYPNLNATKISAFKKVDGQPGPYRPGYMLAYIPALHLDKDSKPRDPFPIRYFMKTVTDDIVDIFTGLFGDGPLAMPYRYRLSHIADAYDNDDGVTRSDHEASIDWEQMRTAMTNIMQNSGLDFRYQLHYAEDQTLYEILFTELTLHGLMPTWEFDAVKRQYVMRVREIGPPSSTAAILEGRALNSSNILRGEVPPEVHTSTWLYNKILINLNYNYDRKAYDSTFEINSPAAYDIQAGKEKTLTINSRLTRLPGLNKSPEMQRLVAAHFAKILSSLMIPEMEVTYRGTCQHFLSLPLGRECVVTDSETHNPATSALGVSNMVATIIAKTDNLGSAASSVTVRLSPYSSVGWAPAMRVTASNKGVGYVNCTTIDKNAFSDSAWGRSDLSFFDCYIHDPVRHAPYEYTARSCACTDYTVKAYEEGLDEGDVHIMTFTIGTIDLAANSNAGTCKLTGTSTNWDTSKTYIVVFADWDDATTQPCQKYYVCGSNEDGQIASTATIDGHKWVV